ALADERRVKDLIVLADPLGNRLEIFHGAETTSEPFKPGRSISGFRTGPLGMGHAVLHVKRIDDAVPFYRDVLGFRLSDYMVGPRPSVAAAGKAHRGARAAHRGGRDGATQAGQRDRGQL